MSLESFVEYEFKNTVPDNLGGYYGFRSDAAKLHDIVVTLINEYSGFTQEQLFEEHGFSMFEEGIKLVENNTGVVYVLTDDFKEKFLVPKDDINLNKIFNQ